MDKQPKHIMIPATAIAAAEAEGDLFYSWQWRYHLRAMVRAIDLNLYKPQSDKVSTRMPLSTAHASTKAQQSPIIQSG